MLMILALDIGNPNTVIGGFSGDKLCCEARISTDAVKTKMNMPQNLSVCLRYTMWRKPK